MLASLLSPRRKGPRLALAVIAGCLTPTARGDDVPGREFPSSSAPAPATPADEQFARTIAESVAAAIPELYDRRQDWGATKEIAVGLKFEGRGLRQDLKRRKKAVEHGVWKHYQVRLVDPQNTLRVTVDDLRPAGPGKMAFALHLDAQVDAWGRAKVYQYGVHLIALEVDADARLRVDVAGEVAVRLVAGDRGPALAVEPTITAAQLRFDEFRIRRVSNARGPLVRELGDEVRRMLERKLDEPTLVAKLNRAIEKKQDRLRLDLAAAGGLAAFGPPAP